MAGGGTGDRHGVSGEGGTAEPEAAARAARRREIEAGLAALVDAEILDEHAARPVGRHSPRLAVVLAYLRQAPTAGKLALLATDEGFSLLELSGEQGRPHLRLDSPSAAAQEQAEQEAFRRRLEQLAPPSAR